jgi:hypothetical protein
MDKLYCFSPIKNEDELMEAIHYVAMETVKLGKKTINQEFPIKSVTIFSHFPDEFEKLKEIVFKIGSLQSENHGPYVKLNKPIKVGGSDLQVIRVRQPDPYRMQVGCSDFQVPDFEVFKNKYLDQVKNLRLIKRPEYAMLEFFDPDFDVLAYLVSN